MKLSLLKHSACVESVNQEQPKEEFVFELAVGSPEPCEAGRKLDIINLCLISLGRDENLFVPDVCPAVLLSCPGDALQGINELTILLMSHIR